MTNSEVYAKNDFTSLVSAGDDGVHGVLVTTLQSVYPVSYARAYQAVMPKVKSNAQSVI